MQASLPTVLLWIRSLFIKHTRQGSCLFLSNKFQFPTSKWNYSSKLIIFSHWNHRAFHGLDTPKPPTMLGCSLCSREQPSCGLLLRKGSSYPRLLVYMTDKPLSISFVYCWMFCVKHSHLPVE